MFLNFEVPFLLETDASVQGLGAVLAQRQGDGAVKPVVYTSRSLQALEKNYGITELEGLVYGHHCDVFTDHEALKSLLNTPQQAGSMGYDHPSDHPLSFWEAQCQC